MRGHTKLSLFPSCSNCCPLAGRSLKLRPFHRASNSHTISNLSRLVISGKIQTLIFVPDLKIMDQHEEDTQSAPMEDTAQRTGSPNFLKDTVYGIVTTNIISQVLYGVFNFFLQYLGICLESAICQTAFGSMCCLALKTVFNRRKKDTALVKDIEACHDHHSRQNTKLDRASKTVEDLGTDISNQEQNGTVDIVRQTLDEPGESSREQNDASLCNHKTSTSSPCHPEEITPIDEGSSSVPPAKGKGTVLEEEEKEKPVLMVLYIKKIELVSDVKWLLKEKFGEAIVYPTFPGSRILYTNLSVKLDEDLLRKARIIVEEGAKIDRDFTLQIENWGIYYCDHHDSAEKRVKLFKLQDSKNQVQVPTILSAEYAIGVLRIYGLHLKGAEIRAATSSKSKKLVTITYEKIAGGRIEMLSCKDLLPDTNLRNLYVYATKPTPIGERGQVINIMSSSVKINDIHLKKALREWLPAIFTVIFVARQLWLSTKPLWNAASAFYSEVYWILPTLVITIFTFLPSKTEEWITENLWSLCFAYSRLRDSVESLGSSGSDTSEDQRIQEKQTLNPSRQEGDSDEDFESVREDDTQSKADTFEVEGKSIRVTPREWEWNSTDLLMSKQGRLVERKRARTIPETRDTLRDEVVPFRVIYDLVSEAPWQEQLYVHIMSSALLGVVEKLVPNPEQVRIRNQSHLVGIRGRTLFLALYKLKDELHQYTNGGTGVRANYQVQQRQLFHLVRFLDKEFAETSSRYERMDRQACVSWDMLWTFLRPGDEVVYKHSVSEEEVCGIVEKARYEMDQQGWKLHVQLKVYDYNCKTFKSYATQRSIPQFEGEIAFRMLEVYPLRFPGKPEASEKHFFDQGTTFGYLSTEANCRYMHYTGIIFRYEKILGRLRLMKEKANGRVMVDLASFFKMNPVYALGSAEPPCDVINKVVEIDISEDPNRKFAPCIVYGFSFRLNKWGAFSVCGFDEIKYNVRAWDELVMDKDLKEMTDVLVGEHLRKDAIPDNVQQSGLDDTTSDKGDSCIVLCSGPVGTGKTLTAEALADKHKAPLWPMNVFELGTTLETLESQLVSIFDVAHSWHALLLLNDADVFVERRSFDLNFERHAKSGIFLRQLEYYKGVLFVTTTNRMPTFDEAFRSRITLSLHYKALDMGQREQIWAHSLDHVKIAADENIDEIVNKVSLYILNGHQIRNAIHNAEKLATQQGKEAGFGTTLMRIVQIMAESLGLTKEERDGATLRSKVFIPGGGRRSVPLAQFKAPSSSERERVI